MTPKHLELLSLIQSHDFIVVDKSHKHYYHNVNKFYRPIIGTYNNNTILQDLFANKQIQLVLEHNLNIARPTSL